MSFFHVFQKKSIWIQIARKNSKKKSQKWEIIFCLKVLCYINNKKYFIQIVLEKYIFLQNQLKNEDFFKNTNAFRIVSNSISIKEEKVSVVEEKEIQVNQSKTEEEINKKETEEAAIVQGPLNYYEKREALKNRKISPDDLVKRPYEDHTYALSIESLSNYLNKPDQPTLGYHDDDTDDADEPFFTRKIYFTNYLVMFKFKTLNSFLNRKI